MDMLSRLALSVHFYNWASREETQMVDPLSYPGAPRWVKVFGIIAIILILLFVILHLSGRGFQGMH